MQKLIILFLFFASAVSGQSISDRLTSYKASHHLEKVYITTDKPYYPLGDTIWSKAYYLDGTTHQSIDLSPILNVDFIDPDDNIYQTLNLKIKDGVANFDLPLDPSMRLGTYTLRAYTQYQKNFDPNYIFQKRIKLFGSNSESKDRRFRKELDIKLFPEGGDLVTGLINRVAYEIRGDTPLNTNFKALLKDQNNDLILEVNLEQGPLGVFSFTPEEGHSYALHLTNNTTNNKFDLPKVLENGFNLSLNGAREDYIYLSASSNPKKLLPGTNLIGHVRGEIFLDVTLSESGHQTLKLARNEIPSGVLSFTLFSTNQNPVCERVCFNYNQSQNINIDLKLDKTDHLNREKVNLQVQTMLDEKISPSKYSVSVYNEDLFDAGDEEVNIVNYLLLNSDLENHISAINKYFTNSGVRNYYLLDLEMMTKAWRRFKWQDVIVEKNPEIKYGTLEHFQFIGIAKEKDKPVKAKVSLLATGADLINSEMITGDDGVFYFKDLDFTDTTKVIISATKYDRKVHELTQLERKNKKKKRPKTRNVNIEYISLDSLAINTVPSYTRTKFTNADNRNRWASKDTNDRKNNEDKLVFELTILDSLATAPWSIEIEEIVIEKFKEKTHEERRIEAKELYEDRGWRYSNNRQMFFLEDIPGAYESDNVIRMASNIIPKTYARPGGNAVLGIYQGKGVAISDLYIEQQQQFVAGVQEQEPGEAVTPVTSWADQYNQVPVLIDYQVKPYELERLDPKKIYAMEVQYDPITGSIVYINLISTNMNDKLKDPKYKNTLSIDHPGYYQSREFYEKEYAEKDQITSSLNDMRTTLYWNPNLKSENQVQALDFYTGDRRGRHVIVVEGIFDSGIPFVKKLNFTVK